MTFPRYLAKTSKFRGFVQAIMYPLQQNQHILGHPAVMSSNLAGISGVGAICTFLYASQKIKEMQDKRSCSSEAPEKVAMRSGSQMEKQFFA